MNKTPKEDTNSIKIAKKKKKDCYTLLNANNKGTQTKTKTHN